VNPRFQWVGEIHGNNTATPTATLNLQSSATSASPTETGFYFNPNGTIHFAPGQTFPGTGITGAVSATSVNSTNGYDLNGKLFATGSFANSNAYLGFAGNTSSTGLDNTANGYKALLSNTTGTSNTASGSFALSSNTTGYYNTADGRSALTSNSTGYYNTASGYVALFSNDTGYFNTALGSFAGPDENSGALTNSTALGFSATVSQDNTLILGQTTVGSPGASYVNVGIGTATPRSTLEAVVQSPSGFGPVLTLTNSGGGEGAASALDFNTYLPSTAGTYNPAASIVAVDAGNYTDFILFESNQPNAPNQGLITTMQVSPRGDVYVTGTLTASAKNFQIDHPLDPTNKYLVHSSVESSEMMNIYSGNVVTDELGLATVKLPNWFEAENGDFRYQLTVIGQFAQAIIKDKIAKGQFGIMTNASHVEVSWQITAVRQDAYAKEHPLVVEQEKPARERGYTYKTPRISHYQPASAVSKKFPVPQPPAMPTVKAGHPPRGSNKASD
jgi:hypothetical protein